MAVAAIFRKDINAARKLTSYPGNSTMLFALLCRIVLKPIIKPISYDSRDPVVHIGLLLADLGLVMLLCKIKAANSID